MTSCITCEIENQGCFNEGQTTYHDYSFFNNAGDPVTLAEKIEYKLSDGISVIKDWTEINPPTAPGQLEISPVDNTIDKSNDRYLTFRVTHSGSEIIKKPIQYELIKDPNG